MQRFEHVSVRLSNDSHAITDISVFHAEQLGELERVGYELCAVTPLSDGTLLMFWKRPHTADAPPTPDFALGFQPPEA